MLRRRNRIAPTPTGLGQAVEYNSFPELRGFFLGKQVEELARFVAQTRCEDIPEAVRRHAKLVLLDTLGVILAGGDRPEVAQLRERLAASAGSGATVYACLWPSHDPRTAALLNGIAGRSIDRKSVV